MSEPVNLNRFRKSRAKADAKAQAAENRVKFGLSKAQKTANAARRDQAASVVDQAKIEKDGGDRS
jgi:hypothetical protein